MSQRVDVPLGARSYGVWVGGGLLPQVGTALRDQGWRGVNAFIITNQVVGATYAPRLESSLQDAGFSRIVRHEVPPTEQGKSWDELTRTCAAMLQAFPEAGSDPLVFLLGGGVVGDLGGFAAAIFRRGVPFVQLPTTLLAAVDSSVGGKVAVNFGGVKNIFGAIAQPRAVWCDLDCLASLPPRELRSGMAEIIKYGAVCSAELWERLEAGDLERVLALDEVAVREVVAHCCQLKADVVARDELDKLGIRNVLNFGHTVGHALELSADYALTHGEAIAIGMVAATDLARNLGLVGADFEGRLRGLLGRAGLPTTFPEAPGLYERVLTAMQADKKFRGGRNVFVLPTGIGEWRQCEDVDWELVHAAIRRVLL